jgi:hypothetical protein
MKMLSRSEAALLQKSLSHVKISPEKVARIWTIAHRERIPALERDILWVETGTKAAGLAHMEKHLRNWEKFGVGREQLTEIAQAATQVGYLMGVEYGAKGKPPTPVYALVFLWRPLDPILIHVEDSS